MSIGLYDADIEFLTDIPFNLELMKLSSYYKKRREIVKFSTVFNPERYGRFIYRKDMRNNRLPYDLSIKNVEYGGLHFTNKYSPLPEDIEMQKPDLRLYDGIKNINTSTYLNADHIRLSLDGKNIWQHYLIPFTGKQPNLIFHDFNLGEIKESGLIISNLIKNNEKPHKVGYKFIPSFNDLDILSQFCQLPLLANSRKLNYENYFSNEELIDFVPLMEDKTILYDTRNVSIKNLDKYYSQIMYARSKGKKMRFSYVEDGALNEYMYDFFDLVNSYLRKDITYTFFEYLDYNLKQANHHRIFGHSQQRMIDMLYYIKENNSSLFELFKIDKIEL